ncbi:MAG TPA: DUF2062 domain-containing protein [Noviherbaspirillum sp.]|nr:DUF2062 domain-containing protein [Noviherbaspirillum sp.]
MRRHRIFQRLPSAQTLKQYRFLRPFKRYLDHHSLWQLNRRAVAGGMAIGLFFGILVPFAQILLAAIAAIVLRVNLPVAAFSTLITNPLTSPGVYYAAYLVGGWLIGDTVHGVESEFHKTLATQPDAVVAWFVPVLQWLQTVGLQLSLGLAVLSVVVSVASYFGVSCVWRLWVCRRWRHRHLRQP